MWAVYEKIPFEDPSLSWRSCPSCDYIQKPVLVFCPVWIWTDVCLDVWLRMCVCVCVYIYQSLYNLESHI